MVSAVWGSTGQQKLPRLSSARRSQVRAKNRMEDAMSAGGIDYGELMQMALRGVMQSALEIAMNEGLPGNHHYYITFKTEHPGVEVAAHLKAQYADEMTVVMQHQFEGLTVDKDGFAITLRFNRKPERLIIPFDAVTAFVDPAVNFALHFQPNGEDEAEEAQPQAGGALAPAAADSEPQSEGEDSEPVAEKGTVVSLDAFRNKK